jgi:hypothetical protein
MHLYTAYGLAIQSELALPELEMASGHAEPDVVVRLAQADLPAPKASNGAGAFLVETEAGRFVLRAGREIVVDPAPGVEEAMTRLFLLGPALAVLLQVRGLLVLHASGVAVKNEAIAFLGDAGWGKSTLAEAFYAQGHPLITDDIMAIQMEAGWPKVLPGFPQVKLWPEAAASLGCSPEQLPQLHSQVSKRAHRLTGGFSQTPLPLRRIYVLGPASPHHEISYLQPQQAFMELVRHSRAVSVPNRPDLDIRHFQQCTQLIQMVPVCRLKRQRSLSALSDLVSLIEADLAQAAD